MSKAENKPKLSPIDVELAAEVREKLGWEFPVDDGGEEFNGLVMTEPSEEEWRLAQEQAEAERKEAFRSIKALSETDPEFAELEDKLNRWLEGEEIDLE